MISIEGFIWILFALDCPTYTVMSFRKPKRRGLSHWIAKFVSLDWKLGLYYCALVAWLGFTLFRFGKF